MIDGFENINVSVLEGAFDRLVKGVDYDGPAILPQIGERIDVAVKQKATVGKQPAVVISFLVMTDDGPRRVQAVTTQVLFMGVTSVLAAAIE